MRAIELTECELRDILPNAMQTHAGRRSRADRRLTARNEAKAGVALRDERPGASGPVPPLFLPVIAILIFAAFCLLPQVYSQPALLASFGLAAGALSVFYLFLRVTVRRSRRALSYEFIPVRVHYVQLVMHSCIFAYWGMYWDEVYRHIPLILAQVGFMYALDMMVCWSRRDKWILGFGPFPIIFSTNLFLWFRNDWFWLQFLMIATIVLCKEFIRWEREGRRVHIFNPSAAALFLFSCGLLMANSTGISWGAEIAGTMQRPPNIYIELFILGLIVQSLFSVTLVTLSAAAALYIFGIAFTHTTGEYYFVDSNIHAAVFLGLHLLVTDPSTSPRRMTGKIIFGALYGAAVIALYAMLQHFQAPQFYDKLLCVPILNLMVRALDRWSEAFATRFHPLNLLQRFGPRKLNFLHMAIWSALFGVMLSTGFLGRGLALKVECENGNAASCVEYGKSMMESKAGAVSKIKGGEAIGRACAQGLAEGCDALTSFVRTGGLKSFDEACGEGDYVACYLSGWVQAKGLGVAENDGLALAAFEKACNGGFAPACEALSQMKGGR
jgi:hypothetical protein